MSNFKLNKWSLISIFGAVAPIMILTITITSLKLKFLSPSSEDSTYMVLMWLSLIIFIIGLIGTIISIIKHRNIHFRIGLGVAIIIAILLFMFWLYIVATWSFAYF